ncbi:MAG: hypothetical protein R2710_07905 [Acidimicrobiales bacterium]
MYSVNSVSSVAALAPARTHTADRATTRPVPDVTNVDPADLRSRLDGGGEALQERAESAGVEPAESAPLGLPSDAAPTVAARPGIGSALGVGLSSLLGGSNRPTGASSTGGLPVGAPPGRDAARRIEDRRPRWPWTPPPSGSRSTTAHSASSLAQNGVQSSIGMLFNTRL